MKKTYKRNNYSRHYNTRQLIPNKLVYPITTTKCKREIPSRWNSIINKNTMNMNKIIQKIINTIDLINFKILKRDIIQLITENHTNSKYIINSKTITPFHQLLFSNFCSNEIVKDIIDNHDCLVKVSFSFQLQNKVYHYDTLFIFCSLFISLLKTSFKSG